MLELAASTTLRVTDLAAIFAALFAKDSHTMFLTKIIATSYNARQLSGLGVGTIMCEHLEREQFGTYNIRVEDSEQEKTATLLKCKSCKSYLTLDSLEIFEGDIRGIAGMSKATNMRTIYVSLDNDRTYSFFRR